MAYLTGPLTAPQLKQTRVRLHLSAITLNRRIRWMRSNLGELHADQELLQKGSGAELIRPCCPGFFDTCSW